MPIVVRRNSKKGALHLTRRVPKRYASVEPRKTISISLHTDSGSSAEVKAAAAWEQLVAGWEAKLAGDTKDAELRFEAARNLAEARGFRYLRADDVAKLPLEDLHARFSAISGFRDSPKKPDLQEAQALLGAVAEPALSINRCLEIYWDLAKDRNLGKSEDQLRRWRNPRIKAIRNLVSVVGDKPIQDITGDDMLAFRNWWLDRIAEANLTASSANKDLIHLGDVLKTVNRLKRLGLVLPLSDLKLKETDAKQRPPFSNAWIKDKLLAPGALDGLNAEARAILLVMVNTGCRPSEIAALTRTTIHLNHNVPHISIEPEVRELKTAHARRKIPLLGVSLEAIRAYPDGFPRYLNSSASLSATVNKFLRANGLAETPAHTLYSLRHSFEDRMLHAGIDDRIRRDLFGHSLTRERYGTGASLEHAKELLQALAF